MKMCKNVIIIGAGGHGKVIADIVRKSNDNFMGFLDDDLSKENVIGKVSDCIKYQDYYFVIGIGNNKIRRKIANEYLNLKYYTAIHPAAVLSTNVKIGKGTVVMANAVVNDSTKIGMHCIINTASVVEHDNYIDDYVHISPNATLCGTVKIGKETHIGAGAVVKNNTSVCENVIVGIAAAIVKNIDKPGTYVGVPGKILDLKE